MTSVRPLPPQALATFSQIEMMDRFKPAPEVAEWIIATFIDDSSPIANPDHRHLAEAEIGVLWTNCDNTRNMRVVIGQAELMPPMAMGKWQRARAIQQVEDWFGGLPDFLLTFSAPASAGMDDASFCALVEHELYHCAQARDGFGMPKFNKEGRPVFAIRGHDVEEFVGVVARYGAIDPMVSAMMAAASQRPSVALADISGACGTCALKAA